MTQDFQDVGGYNPPDMSQQPSDTQLSNDLDAIVNDAVGTPSSLTYDEQGRIVIHNADGSVYTKIDANSLPDVIREKDRYASELKQKADAYEKLIINQQNRAPVYNAPPAPAPTPNVDYVSLGIDFAQKSGLNVDTTDDNAMRGLGLVAFAAEQRAMNVVDNKLTQFSIRQQIMDATNELRSINPNVDNDPLWLGCLEYAKNNGGRPMDAKNLYMQRSGQMQQQMQTNVGYGQQALPPKPFAQNLPMANNQNMNYNQNVNQNVNQQGLRNYVDAVVQMARQEWNKTDPDFLREVAEKAKQTYISGGAR